MQYRKLLFLTIILTSIFVVGNVVLAQLGVEYGASTGLGQQDLRLTIANIIRVALGLVGIIILALMVYAGFLWMTAVGDTDKIDRAKHILINATIGLAITLSALAITQFIISQLRQATGLTEGGPGPGGGPGGGLGGGAYVLRGISPSGQVAIRNVVARAIFSGALDSASVAGNFEVRRDSDNTPVAGDIKVIGSELNFTPSADCPAPNNQIKCFEENTEYVVEVKSGIKSASGQPIVCGGLAPACTQKFTTGSEIDLTPPSVSLLWPNQSFPYIYASSLNQLQANAIDDSGIAYVKFLKDEALIDTLVPSASVKNYNAVLNWDGAGLQTGSKVNLNAAAGDLDNHETVGPSLEVTVLAAHCNNGIKDADETGVDSGGADCLAGTGASCQNNTQCASGSCVNNQCVDQPLIMNVAPLDGAIGNLVTISGKYFGNTPGQVVFLGGAGSADDQIATLASCGAPWTNTQIIAAVPANALTGPIQVTAANTLSDDTKDIRGPSLGDFIVNNTIRPGICGLSPNNGSAGDEVTILGTQFGAGQGSSEVRFETRLAEIVSGQWNNTKITTIVPKLVEGSYRVTIIRNNSASNPVLFSVKSLSATLPEISYLDPLNGPVGEYVTIFGQRFGATPGTVIFKNPTTGDEALGSTDFPAQCGLNFWHDDYIIIKAPSQYKSGLAISKNAPLEVYVVRADGAKSTAASFTINNNQLKPGLCQLSPDNGPVGTLVNVLGEHFNDAPGAISFFDDQDGSIAYWNPNGAEVAARVPAGAKTGAVKLWTKANLASNGVNFEVADCRQVGCGAGEQCCGASCIPGGEICATVKQAGFMWRVATGPLSIIPHVVEEQSCALATQSPSPWKNSLNACQNASINVRFNTLMDYASFNLASVRVSPCGTGVNGNFSDALCAGQLNEFSNFIFTDTPVGTGVTVNGSDLAANLFYRVTIDKSVTSAGGVPMSASYNWHFKVASSTAPCALSQVQVSPFALTLTDKYVTGLEKNSQGKYVAAPEALNCNVLKCDAYQWNWTLSGPPNTALLSTATCQAKVSALAETGATPLDVVAEAKTLAGLDPHSDTAKLTIKFADPAVIDYWPNCGAACVNAQVGAAFNTALDPATINAGTVKVLECTEESCSVFNGEVLLNNIAYDPGTSILRLYPEGLKPNAYYRVRLGSGILSSDGAKLTGLNELGQYFSWVFKTKNDATLCGIARTEISPAQATARIIGESTVFTSVPYGSADSCNSAGQALNPTAYAWDWSSSQVGVGNLQRWQSLNWSPYNSQTGELFNFSPRLNNQACNASCLLTGAATLGTCGNNQIDKGENCDDNNQNNGDGCSAKCLAEGSNAFVMVAGYTMDDGDISGSTIADQSGYGHDGTLNGTVSAIGKINQARNFNGRTDFISVADSNRLDLTTEISISLWVKLNALSTGANFVDKGQSGYIFAMYPNGRLTLSKNEVDELQSLGALTTNTWYHLAATAKNGLRAIYINGILDNSASGQADFSNTANPLRIGIDFAELFKTNGLIDDVRIYNQALTSAEIKQIYMQSPMAPLTGAICGNNIKEIGETCDDGNTNNSDGCSGQCLNEGSIKGGSVCGNGDKGKGEDCDDGNKTNGDGCSSICLAEGATSAAAAGCGNGTVEPSVGEQCDDGVNNGKRGYGCSAKCLLTGSTAGAFCSNNIIETGEACDDGNVQNGDGCSSQCLNEGSSIYYYNVYNPKLTGDFGSVCGNRVIERGEDCDAGLDTVNDKGIDPLQVVRAVSGVGTKNQSKIEVATAGLVGVADYTVQCGARVDFDCNGGINAGAGAGTCCYMRPMITASEPQGANVCRNAAVIARFNQVMAEVSFQKNVSLLKAKGAATTCLDSQTINNVVYCSGPQANFEFRNFDDNNDQINDRTDLVVRQTAAFEPNTAYAIVINGDGDPTDKGKGVLSVNQVGLDTPQYVWTFKTGADICKIQTVGVSPANRYFRSVAEQQQFTSRPLSRSGLIGQLIELSPTPSYRWTNSWTVPNDGLLQIAGATNEVSAVARPQNKNGHSTVSVSLAITDNTSSPATTEEASGSAKVINFICLNPVFIPDETKQFYLGFNKNYNFSLAYCRDNNTPDSTQDDLPDLKLSKQKPLGLFVNPPAMLAYNKIKSSEVVRMALEPGAPQFDPTTIVEEKIIVPDCSSLEESYRASCKNNDAFGLRVISNPNNLNPLDWYQANGFLGTPALFSVNGYEAIVDGRTVYVVAANVTKDSAGQPITYNNVYVLSYSQNATPETIRIFNQLLGNWQINTNLAETRLCQNTTAPCASDLDCQVSVDSCVANKCQTTGLACQTPADCVLATTCNADLQKVRRNLKRVTDLVHTSNQVLAYQAQNGQVPTLREGSFVRATTLSAWPSWQAALAGELKDPLPTDPLNKFSACGWLDDQIGTDKKTCWNAKTSNFSCSPDSAVYWYETADPNAYTLYGQLETTTVNTGPAPIISNVSFALKNQKCNASVISSGPIKCGNGVVEFGEQCDGNPLTECNNGAQQVCNTGCQWASQSCTRASCGNGIVEPKNNEVCDDGAKNGSYGYCNTTCSGIGLYCGDNQKQPAEFCDAGSANDAYYLGLKVCANDSAKFCGLDSDCANGARCVPQSVSCNALCNTYGPYCGDRLVNGAEVCDNQTVVGDRLCERKSGDKSGSSYKICSSDASCPSGEKCLVSASATYGVKTRWSAACNGACQWKPAGPIEIGQCQNGVVEPGEECDDGNQFETDNCTNVCKLARCGDGQTANGVEQCDQGANNGQAPVNVLYGKTQNYCGATCKIVTVSGGSCGDRQVSGPEQCDSSALSVKMFCVGGICVPMIDPSTVFAGKTCADYEWENGQNFGGGNLSCTANCSVDTAQCTAPMFITAKIQGALDWTDNSSCSLGGYAIYDTTDPNPVSVSVYKDDPSVAVNKIGAYLADQDKPDLTTRFGLVDTKHGFEISLPAGLKDNIAHNIFVFGIEKDGKETQLDNVPKSITCAPPPPAPTITLSAFPTSVSSGGASNLTWGSNNATSCSGTFPLDGLSGSATTGPLTSSKTYTLQCNGPGGTATQSVTVTVIAPAPTISFTATPASITAGGSSKLTWTTTNATDCTSSDFNTGNAANNTVGVTVTPAATKTYTLNCNGSGGNATKAVTVTVTPAVDIIPPTVVITAPASGATVSGIVTISANASDNVGVKGVRFYADGLQIGAEDPSAPYSIAWDTTSLNGAVTLYATAFDTTGNATRSAFVSVTVNNVAAVDNAEYVIGSQVAPPSVVIPGKTGNGRVTMKNIGTTAWTASNYFLTAANPWNTNIWGIRQIKLDNALLTYLPKEQDEEYRIALLPFDVATGATHQFLTTGYFIWTAPTTPGKYNFQWQMAKKDTIDPTKMNGFGEFSPNAAVTVCNNVTGGQCNTDISIGPIITCCNGIDGYTLSCSGPRGTCQ